MAILPFGSLTIRDLFFSLFFPQITNEKVSCCFCVGAEPFIKSIDVPFGPVGIVRTTAAAVAESDAAFTYLIGER